MQLPLELKTAIEALTEGQAQAKMAQDAQAISQRYRQNSGDGISMVTTASEAAAYAAVRMPATFGAVYTALQYSLEQVDTPITTLLDIGAGTGAASWAADSLLDLQQLTCLERIPAMADTGRRLMGSGSKTLKNARWISADAVTAPLSEKAGLVAAAYFLNELTASQRKSVLEKLWQAAGEMLLLVEPGTPEGFRILKEAREILIGQGAHIAAPCPHEGPCKLMENDWCHFTCRVARSRLHMRLKGGEVPYEDEKFTYLAAVRTSCRHADSRVLRHPFIESGKISLTLCTKDEIQPAVIRKKDGPLFKAARKAACGDAFPYQSKEIVSK